MIGYQMMADSYRKLLEQKRDTFTESEIKEFERGDGGGGSRP